MTPLAGKVEEGCGDRGRRPGSGQKVYLVIAPVRLPQPGRPNTKIMCARQTFQDAAKLADEIPGATVLKFYIGKGEPTPDEIMKALAL